MCGVLGGKGGGLGALVSRFGGGGGAGLRLGGAGGADTFRSLWEGREIPDLGERSSSIGVFGGRGGGGGPGLVRFEPEVARCRVGPVECANFPASAIGGGARNLGLCGDDSRGGDLGGESWSDREGTGCSGRALLEGGGGGGAPRRPDALLPVFCGLMVFVFDAEGGAEGGGGGGGALAFF